MKSAGAIVEEAAAGVRQSVAQLDVQWIEPPVLQPSDVYLELAGEDIRARAFLVEGDSGLCVRPDMTVPAVRFALANLTWDAAFGVAYDGLVFRKRDSAHDDGEFRQVGVERFDHSGSLTAQEAALVTRALEACGVLGADARLRLGDIAVFEAFVDCVALPERWARRFKRAFVRPGGLSFVLERARSAAQSPLAAPDNALARALARLDASESVDVVADLLSDARIALVGSRSLAEIAERLRAKGTGDDTLPRAAQISVIEEAASLSGAPDDVFAALEAMARRSEIAHPEVARDAIARAASRWAGIGRTVKDASFSAGFGGGLAYYDGFVFELEAPALGARASLGGGGRYDGLLHRLALKETLGPMPPGAWGAMGFALRPDRISEASR